MAQSADRYVSGSFVSGMYQSKRQCEIAKITSNAKDFESFGALEHLHKKCIPIKK